MTTLLLLRRKKTALSSTDGGCRLQSLRRPGRAVAAVSAVVEGSAAGEVGGDMGMGALVTGVIAQRVAVEAVAAGAAAAAAAVEDSAFVAGPVAVAATCGITCRWTTSHDLLLWDGRLSHALLLQHTRRG